MPLIPIYMAKELLIKSPKLPEEHKRVITKYYPELEQKLEGKYVEINIDDVEPLLRKISRLFDNGFGKSEIRKVKKLLDSGVENDNLIFSAYFRGMKVLLVIEIIADTEDIFNLGFFTNNDLPALIDKVIDVYVEEVYW